VALAWLMARGMTAPIASATRVAQLDEQLDALELTLDSQMLARLDAASA
jgi:aryl-alcohol dehydrogenase-like predicted oxidoreductase